MRVDQLIPAFHWGDAIGDTAFHMKQFFQTQGLASQIYCLESDKGLEGESAPFTSFPKPIGIVNSTIFAGSRVGMDVIIACPKGYDPDDTVLKPSLEEAKKSGGSIKIVRDIKEAVDGADVDPYGGQPDDEPYGDQRSHGPSK